MLYVGDNRGSVYKILNSTNVSTPFIDITGPDFPGVGYVTSIDVNPTNSNKVMVAFSNYQTLSLFYSSDGGASWSNVGGNLESNNLDGSGAGPSIRCVKILPGTDGTEYFTGTSIGLFSTTQLNGTNTIWLQEAPNKIGNMIVESIDARYVDGKVVVGTFGKGVFSSSITTTDVASEQTLPGSFQLKQNYPNPFNPTTVIEYSVPKDGFVNLAVYNSIGERVANLENNYKSAGSYNASFDAENLASGIYVYRLDSEGFSLSKKMVLLR
jgi:hypothetical protein